MIPTIAPHAIAPEQLYASFEQTVACKNGDLGNLAALPRFNGNKSQAIHRWFTFKEGFSSGLLMWACDALGIDLDETYALLDPFCGVSTSLLSAQLNYRGTHPLCLVGIERNPLIAFVARSKLAWQSYRKEIIATGIPTLVEIIRGREVVESELPGLSTVQNLEAFNRRRLNDLLFARRVIEESCPQPERDFFLLGWVSIIETVSNMRKDGRGLRFVDKAQRPPVYRLLEIQWRHMLEDLVYANNTLRNIRRGEIHTVIHEGDGRTLGMIDTNRQLFDLIVYSPPYLNNIDYSEVYKLELWISGLVRTPEEFRDLRRSTFRSHPSIRFYDTRHLESFPPDSWPRRLVEAIVASIPNDEDAAWRARLVGSYTDDLIDSLRSQFRVAKPGANVVCVVGNSLHGRVPNSFTIPTDLLIASLAQTVGFDKITIQIARFLRRRHSSSRFLRESVITFRKPREAK